MTVNIFSRETRTEFTVLLKTYSPTLIKVNATCETNSCFNGLLVADAKSESNQNDRNTRGHFHSSFFGDVDVANTLSLTRFHGSESTKTQSREREKKKTMPLELDRQAQ